MALTSEDFTLLATLKDRLGITSSTYNDRLEAAIKSASRMIVNFIGHKIHYDAAIVEKQKGHGSTMLVVDRRPLWSITSITFDGETVDSDDYSIDSIQAGIVYASGGWTWTSDVGGEGIVRDAVPDHERSLYIVTYAGGWQTPNQVAVAGVDALPVEIEEACLQLATHLWAQQGTDVAVTSESLLSYSASYGNAAAVYGSSGIPMRIEGMIRSYQSILQA